MITRCRSILFILFVCLFFVVEAFAQGEGGYTAPPMSIFSQGLITNTNAAGWTTALGVSAGGTPFSAYLYVDLTNGNDGTAQFNQPGKPWKTVTNAMTSAPSGSLINVSGGTEDFGTNLFPRVANITVRGAGPFQTIFTSEIAQVSAGTNMACFIGLANNDVFEDFQIFHTVTNTFCIPIGSSAMDATYTNAVVRRVYVIGQSDGFMDATPNIGNQSFCYDCYFLTAFDGVNHLAQAGLGTNYFFNCVADSSLPGWGGGRSGIGAQTGVIVWQGGKIRCISDTAQNFSIGLKSQSARIIVQNTVVESVGATNVDYFSGATPPYGYTNLALIDVVRADNTPLIGVGKFSTGQQNLVTATNATAYGIQTTNGTANSVQFGDGTGSINVNSNGTITITGQIPAATITNETVVVASTIQTVNGSNVNAGTLLVTNLTSSPHFSGRGSAPTLLINTNGSGAGATVSADANASDAADFITLVTGTGPNANKALFTNGFAAAYATAPHVVFAPSDGNAAFSMTNVFVTNVTTTNFEFWPGTAAITASKTYHWTFQVIQ